MFDVLVQKRRKNDDVVNIYFGKFSVRAENSVDHTLDVCRKIKVTHDRYSRKKIDHGVTQLSIGDGEFYLPIIGEKIFVASTTEMNLEFLIWDKISVCENTGYTSGIVILFNALMSITTRFSVFHSFWSIP